MFPTDIHITFHFDWGKELTDLLRILATPKEQAQPENDEKSNKIHDFENWQNCADLDMSIRLRNCLLAADITSLEELEHYKKSDLMRFKNFGKKSMRELEALMEKYGLHFFRE